ncbi:MAG: hypothetical protein R3B40_17155 [Polyangiales bacterium]
MPHASRLARCLAAVITVSALCIGVRATAQAPEDADQQALLRDALVEFEAQRWAEARALLRRVYDVRPSGEALRLLGAASYELRLYVEAVDYFERSLTEERRPLSDTGRASASEGLIAARRFVGTLELDVRPADTDVEISVDGESVPAGLRRLRLVVGHHRVTARSPGFRVLALSVDIAAESTRSVTLRLEREAEVSATAPPADAQPPLASADSGEDEPPATSPRGHAGAIAMLAVGATLVGGAVAAGIWWRERNGELEQCPCARPNMDAIGRERNAAAGLSLGAALSGLALVTTGVVRLRRAGSAAGGERDQAGVRCSLRGAVLVCGGSF